MELPNLCKINTIQSLLSILNVACQALCSQPGARGSIVKVSGAEFQTAVSNYIKTNTSQYGNIIQRWDTSIVTDMTYAFDGQAGFNEPLNCWDTSNVETFRGMFLGASSFNQDLDA